MKRKSVDRVGWRRLMARRCHTMRLDTPKFIGYRTLLLMDAVSEPFSVRHLPPHLSAFDKAD